MHAGILKYCSAIATVTGNDFNNFFFFFRFYKYSVRENTIATVVYRPCETTAMRALVVKVSRSWEGKKPTRGSGTDSVVARREKKYFKVGGRKKKKSEKTKTNDELKREKIAIGFPH